MFGTTTCFASLPFDLADQANSATIGHAAGHAPLTAAQRDAIVDFETRPLHRAAARRPTPASLDGARAPTAGRRPLASAFYFGINDTLVGDYRTARRVHADV